MPTKYIRRAATAAPGQVGLAAASPIYMDSDTGTLKVIPGATGTTEHEICDLDTAQTLTGKTISGATISGTIASDTKVLAADFAADSSGTGATLTSLSGFSWSVVAGAKYIFRLIVPKITQTANGGAQMALKLTTATLTSINLRVILSTDTDNTGEVSTNFTTTTDQATWFNQKTAVYTDVIVEGSFVVNAAGTIAVQAAQNTSHADTTTIVAGAFAELKRVA